MTDKYCGYRETITYRTARGDDYYKFPMEGLFSGKSVSHVASRYTFDTSILNSTNFTPEELGALHGLCTPAKNGQSVLYFSFWPKENWDPVSTSSRLETHQHDTAIAALGAPMPMQEKFQKYLHQDSETVSSFLPIIKFFSKTQMPLGPSIVFHENAFETQYGENARIAGEQYAKDYEKWCNAELAVHNAQESFFSFLKPIAKLKADADAAKIKMDASLNQLKIEINAAKPETVKADNSNLMQVLEEHFTFGTPEKDTVPTPLTMSKDPNAPGLKIIPMLKLIADIKLHPEKYPYNLATNNCENMDHMVLAAGAEGNAKLERAVELPWYVRFLPFPAVPAMELAAASRANQVIEQQRKEAEAAEYFAKTHEMHAKQQHDKNRHHDRIHLLQDAKHYKHKGKPEMPPRFVRDAFRNLTKLFHHTNAQVIPASKTKDDPNQHSDISTTKKKSSLHSLKPPSPTPPPGT